MASKTDKDLLKFGMKYYRITEDLKLEELEYVGMDNSKYVFHDQYYAEVKLAKYAAENLSPSRIITLNELEEKLRFRINHVHDQLRRAKQKFNPLDTVNTITTVKNSSSKEIHQYDKLSGKYMNSYPTITSALKAITGDSTKLDKGNIAGCANGDRPTAFGYRWSYVKVVKLVFKSRGKEVHQYSKTGEYLNSYSSAKLAVYKVTDGKGKSVTDISNCCHNKRFSCYGYRWSYTKFDKLFV